MNREDWLMWRKSGIGASDAPIIMGASPYSDILKLYDEKVSEAIEEKTNFIMEKGNQLEPIARAKYEFELDKEFPPANFVHANKPHYRCSLDGYNEAHAIEIKYCGKNFTENCPDKYYPQIQYQYHVAMLEKNTLVQINDMNQINIIEIPKDDIYISAMLIRVDWFWDCVINKRRDEIETALPLKKTRKKKC